MSTDPHRHDTWFDLASKVVQGPDMQHSPQNTHQKEAIKLSKERKPSPNRDHPGKALTHEQVCHIETTKGETDLHPSVKKESPWESYRKEFSCELAGAAVAVIHRKHPSKVFLLRSYPEEIAAKMLQWFTQLQHPHIMSVKECFVSEKSLYALSEDLPLTLEHLVVCRAYPTEARLSLIMRQILAGLSYLTAARLEHRSLNSSNILMGLDGVVKLGSLEDIHAQNQKRDQRETLKALETITMELMEKHSKKSGAAGVNDLKRWPPDSNAFRFLAATELVSTVNELEKHPLITECHETASELVGLARFALITTRTFYAYP